MELLIASQSPTVNQLKFENGLVISSHTFPCIWLLILVGIKVNPCQWKRPLVTIGHSKWAIKLAYNRKNVNTTIRKTYRFHTIHTLIRNRWWRFWWMNEYILYTYIETEIHWSVSNATEDSVFRSIWYIHGTLCSAPTIVRLCSSCNL